MEVTIDRNELRESMEVLELLERWEKIAKAPQAHSQGRVVFIVDGNVGRETIEVCVDARRIAEGPSRFAVDRCMRAIEQTTSRHLDALVSEVKAIIREQMPLPIK